MLGAALTATDDGALGRGLGATVPTATQVLAAFDQLTGVLSAEASAAHATVVFGMNAAKLFTINGAPVECTTCPLVNGQKVYATTKPSSTGLVKSVRLTVKSDAAPADVVLDYRAGSFLAANPLSSAKGVEVVVEAGAAWRFGVYGSAKADALTVGATGFAMNRDANADLKWTGAAPTLVVMHGGAGNDVLSAAGDVVGALRGVGAAFADEVELGGGLGNDRLTGGDGADKLFGHAGKDTFVMEPTESMVGDLLHGGADADIVDWKKSTAPVVVTPGEAFVPFKDGSGVFIAQRCALPAAASSADPKALWVEVPLLDWTTAPNAANAALRKGDGRLVDPTCKPLEAPAGIPCATEGDELVEVERFNASPLADVLVGDCGSNLFYAGLGNDTLMPGGGVGGSGDGLLGEAGDDLIIMGPFANGPTFASGGTGTADVISYALRQKGVFVTSQRGRPGAAGTSGELATPDGAAIEGDLVVDFETLIGTDAADRLTGSSASNRIEGRGGDDVLSGDKGNDTIFGGLGNDQLNGGVGNDTLVGGPGADVGTGDVGNDRLIGDNGRYCQNAVTTLCTSDASCAGSTGPCVFDSFCPDKGDQACADQLFGGPGVDTFEAVTDPDADVFHCGDELREEARGVAASLRRQDVVSFEGATGEVNATADGVADDGLGGIAGGDLIGPSCESLKTTPPPSAAGKTWTLETATTPAPSYPDGGDVVLRLTNAPTPAILRTDVTFIATLEGSPTGAFHAPKVVSGALEVVFVPSASGEVTITAAAGLTAGTALDTLDLTISGAATSSCFDLQKNGTEEGVDCGPDCSFPCAAPTCTDGVRNGAETDIDCGGLTCAPCAAGDYCADALDCGGAPCVGSRCQKACNGCTNCTAGMCNACPTGRELIGGQCLRPCPDTDGDSNTKTWPSVDGRCSCPAGQTMNTAGTACVACTAGVRCNVCAANHLPNAGGICTELLSGVCPGIDNFAPDAVDGRCVCADGFALDAATNACVAVASCPTGTTAASGVCGCPAKQRLNLVGACVACPAGCDACALDDAGAVVCTACSAPADPTKAAASVLFNGRCLARCPSGSVRDGNSCVCDDTPPQFADGTSCKRCADGCAVCASYETCEQCDAGFQKLNGLCVPGSPAGTTTTPDGLTCATGYVFDPVTVACVTCEAGERVVDGTCAPCSGGECDDCNPPKFLTYVSGTPACTDCSTGCAACDGPLACRACETGHTLWQGLCVPPCGAGLVFSTTLGRCVADPNAGSVTCAEPQFADQGVCVDTCPSGKFANSNTRSCVSLCPSGTFGDSVTQACVAMCPDGSFADGATRTCAATCSGSTFADPTTQTCAATCSVATFADATSKACVTTCPAGAFPDTATRACGPCTGGRRTISFSNPGGSSHGNVCVDFAMNPEEIGSLFHSLPLPSKAGQYFAGWWTEASSTTNHHGVRIAPSDKFVPQWTNPALPVAASSVTLHARWTAHPERIVFDVRGGTLSGTPGCDPTGIGFIGGNETDPGCSGMTEWYSCTGTQLCNWNWGNPGCESRDQGACNGPCYWDEGNQSCYFNGSGFCEFQPPNMRYPWVLCGHVYEESSVYDCSSGYDTISSTTNFRSPPARSGYVFSGWATGYGSGAQPNEGSDWHSGYRPTAPVTLYAKWRCPAGKAMNADKVCAITCPAGQWSEGFTCQPCHASCGTCVGPNRGDCSSCPAGRIERRHRVQQSWDCTNGNSFSMATDSVFECWSCAQVGQRWFDESGYGDDNCTECAATCVVNGYELDNTWSSSGYGAQTPACAGLPASVTSDGVFDAGYSVPVRCTGCAAGYALQDGVCVSAASCGNGSCEPGEDCNNCGDCTCSVSGSCMNHENLYYYCDEGYCGNNTCESGRGEDCNSCSQDCGCSGSDSCNGNGNGSGYSCQSSSYCGNASCESGEDCSNCSQDCGCGNGYSCNSDGTRYYCDSWSYPSCGNNSCESGEDCNNCSQDCGCGDGTCYYVGPYYSCTAAPSCGDGSCDGSEASSSCPSDCCGGLQTNYSSSAWSTSCTQTTACVEVNTGAFYNTCQGPDANQPNQANCALGSGSPFTCSYCDPGYYLHNGGCYATCPDGSYADSSSTCAPCHSSCGACTGGGESQCTTCSNGFYRRPSGSGEYSCISAHACSAYHTGYILGDACVSDCPMGYSPNQECFDGEGCSVYGMFCRVMVDYCHVQWPCSIFMQPGSKSENIYVWVYQDGVTTRTGPGGGITVEVGYGKDDPRFYPNWFPTNYNADTGPSWDSSANDEYAGQLDDVRQGFWHYAARVSADDGRSWRYCDLGGDSCGGVGSSNGWGDNLGSLRVDY